MRFLVVALIALLGGFAPAVAQDTPVTLTVTGEGTASAPPDMATVSLGVQASADAAAEAMNQVSEAVAGLLTSIEAAGIDAADVRTTGLSLNPRYAPPLPNQSGPRVDGYQANNSVTLTVRDLDGLGPLLGQLVGEGANTLNGLSFDVADPAPLLSEAERNAVADARRSAEVLAEAAGMTLGPVLTIVEGGGGMVGGPIMRSMAMEEAAAVPIAGGSISRAASVTVTYQLMP